MKQANHTTKNPAALDPTAAGRWMAGLAVGAAGIGGLAGVDEAYGAIITLDNGGPGWVLNKPAYTPSPGLPPPASVVADIGDPGSARFGLSWYNDWLASTARFFGASQLNAFQRNTASATPGPNFNSDRFNIRSPGGALVNNAQTGDDNWLAISIDDLGINGGTTTTGWAQLDIAATTHTISRILYSDAGKILHLDGTGGVTELDDGNGNVPEPPTLALLAAGAGGIVALRRRRKSAGSTAVR